MQPQTPSPHPNPAVRPQVVPQVQPQVQPVMQPVIQPQVQPQVQSAPNIPAPMPQMPPQPAQRALEQPLNLNESNVADEAAPPPMDIRRSLVQRLADVICIPESQLTPQERHMAGDVLVEMLREADVTLREGVAKRLTMLNEAPRTILMILAKDDIDVAKHVLEKTKSLTDSDLIQICRKVSGAHRKVIAQRRHISDALVDVMVEFMEEDVVETLLSNKSSSFSETALQRILTMSRAHPPYVELLLKREELRPSHGLTMFWWADHSQRKRILKRFSVARSVLQSSCADLYPKAAADGWSDSAVRKALQFIERRQRNRAAIERSKFEGLEQAIDFAAEHGLTRELTQEISYMAGIKPATGAQILMDKSGEAVAILCKAPGLKREYVTKLWKALKRPLLDGEGIDHPDLKRVISVYDEISTDKAQTVLRYWNWSLTSALNAEVLKYIKDGVIPREEEHGAAAISAALVFGLKQR